MRSKKPDIRSIVPIEGEPKKSAPKKRRDGETASESKQLGDERLADGEVNDAIHHYRRALRQDDTDVEARLRLADSYDLAELGPQAAKQYEKLLKGKRQRPEAHVGLADVYRRYGKHKAAIVRLRKACELNPSNAFYWFRLAEAIVAAGEPAEAVGPAERASEAEPNDPFYSLWLGKLLLKVGKGSDAVPSLERAVRLEPGDHEAWFLLSAAFAAAHEQEFATHAITRAGDLAPDSKLYKACIQALDGEARVVPLEPFDKPLFESWLAWAGVERRDA